MVPMESIYCDRMLFVISTHHMSTTPNGETPNPKKLGSGNSFHPSSDLLNLAVKLFLYPTKSGRDVARKPGAWAAPGQMNI